MKMYCIKDVKQAIFVDGAKLHKNYGRMCAYWHIEYPNGSIHSKFRKRTCDKFYSNYRHKLLISINPNGFTLFTTASFRLTDEG